MKYQEWIWSLSLIFFFSECISGYGNKNGMIWPEKVFTPENENNDIYKGLRKTETMISKSWKLTHMNVQSLITENSKLKGGHFTEFTKNNNVILIDMLEIWCNERIQKEVNKEQYKTFQADSKCGKRWKGKICI